MTHQSLRELVAKWRKEAREEYDTAHGLGQDGAIDSAKRMDARAKRKAEMADELESLLGEQREAQGAVEYLKEAVSLAASMASDLRDELDFDDNDDPQYRAAKDIETHLLGTLIGLEDFPKTASPLAESMGDVKALARELAESIDFTDDRAQARVVFEKILPALLRKHVGREG